MSSDTNAQDPTPPDVALDEAVPARKRTVGTHRVMRTNDPEGDALKVAVLTEALPWLREFHGNVVVVKYGGHLRRRLVDRDVGRGGVLRGVPVRRVLRGVPVRRVLRGVAAGHVE